MLDVILQSAALIAVGVLWRVVRPLGLDGDTLRLNLTGVVYGLLLPALVLVVLWRAPLTTDAVRVALSAVLGIGGGMFLAWLWFARRARHSNAVVGALLLASSFPNATYLGLPVLETSLGSWARTVAIQYDLFACTPILLSVGVILAARFGGVGYQGHPALALLRVPPLWAAIAGVALNLTGVPLAPIVAGWLDMLAAGVVPLMLFSLGLGLRWNRAWVHQWPVMVPVVLIQLVAMPALVWIGAGAMGLSGETLTAVTLEAGMPSMVLGVVLCDRYRLDTGIYAMAVTVTTAAAMVTLPFLFEVLK